MVRCDECGFGRSPTGEHDKRHEWWDSGISVPSNVSKPINGRLVVTVIGTYADRELAYEMARLAQMELG